MAQIAIRTAKPGDARAIAEIHVSTWQTAYRGLMPDDFLAAMRDYARSIRPNALITANNSLNSAEVLYSQCRSYAYNIYEMSQTEDFVVVEDMSSQPRTLANGQTFEYAPTYKQLHAISAGDGSCFKKSFRPLISRR